MEISGSMSQLAQAVATNKAQAGFDVLTKTLAKPEQNQQADQQRQDVAEQTGKGLTIDIKA